MRVVYNARIFTQNPAQPWASALAIRDGWIVAAGSDADIRGQFAGADEVDLHGQTVWPGLTDAHIHLEHYAAFLQMIDCETNTKAECLRRVAEKARSAAPQVWVRGHGWNQNSWPEGFGTRQELDAVAPSNPVFLSAKSLHAAWVNSAALQAAGITQATPDPQGGWVQRDANGEPTGILFESAMALVQEVIPEPDGAALSEAIGAAQRVFWKMGITGVHDFDRGRCFAALQMLQARDSLKLRVIKSIALADLDHAIAVGLRSGFGNDLLRIGPVKLFADGALGPRTAAMLQPYENDGDNTGILLLDNEEIYEHGQKASANGINMAIHAIGDRANHEVLIAYANLRQFEQHNNLPALRHRIEHVQVLHPDDYGRLAQLNVTASVQPIHATSDLHMADQHWGRRSAGAYAFATLQAHGTALCFGSDAPVESPNPFLGLHAAVTRQRVDGTPGADGWYPEQRLSLEQALHGFTLGAAYAAGVENRLGRLAPGYLADLIVLERDPFSQPATELWSLAPTATMVGGEWTWNPELGAG
jgi:predicted amidohydrolase YtcJ